MINNLTVVRDLWWIGGALLSILLLVWRLAIKTNKAMESIADVKSNARRIDELQDKIENLEKITDDILMVVTSQKKDIAELTEVLLTVLDELKALSKNETVNDAAKDFRKHLIITR